MAIRVQLAILMISVVTTSADISHLLLPEFGFFQTPQQHPPLPFLYAPPHPPPQNPLQPVPPVSATTEFFLPEVIINRNVKANKHNHGGFIPLNQYLPPSGEGDSPSLIQQDHLKPPSSEYLPPKQDDAIDPIVVLDEPSQNGYEYEKPSSTTKPFIEEPQLPGLVPPQADAPFDNNPQQGASDSWNTGYHYQSPAPAYLPTARDAGSQVRIHVKEMRCLQQQGAFFRAVLRVDSFLGAVPTVDNDSADQKCELKLSRSYLVVNIAGEDFQKCGVQQCGKDLCLRLRFPSIRGMRTSADSILSLHCKTQSRVAVKTHALKMGVSNELQARSAGVYAHGGSQNEFRTQIELLRKSSNGYTRHLEPNGVVQLGEDLLLRAHVVAGDGWNYTKLTDVSLQRISPSGEVISSANLITSRGCVNPSMRSVCSQPPTFEQPLGYRLPFKAVMFKGMRSGDEMVLSMRITGCLEHHDCYVNTQECNDGSFLRQRRDLSGNNSTEFSEISKISFRVEIPTNDSQALDEPLKSQRVEARNVFGTWIIGGVMGFVGLLSLVGLVAYCKLQKYL